jgi:metal-sulfur cluster biosynthetic enzyme
MEVTGLMPDGSSVILDPEVLQASLDLVLLVSLGLVRQVSLDQEVLMVRV